MREITVTVSDWKVNDIRAAALTQAGAVALTIIGFAFPALFAGAATAEATARILANAALDPPDPGPNFLEPVDPITPLLGALQANDLTAAAAQAKAYVAAVGQMETAASSALATVGAAIEELANYKIDDAKLGDILAQWQFSGAMAKDSAAALLQAGCPQEDIDLLSQAGASPQIGLAASDVPATLRALAAAVGDVVVSVRDATPAVLRLVPTSTK